MRSCALPTALRIVPKTAEAEKIQNDQLTKQIREEFRGKEWGGREDKRDTSHLW